MNDAILRKELYHSFLFFMDHTNLNENSKGFGLITDSTEEPNKASIASVGFGLSMLVVGVENGFIKYDYALSIVKGTFRTFLYNISCFHGFFVHYCDLNSGKSYKLSEYSTIDSIFFYNSTIVCDAYFKDEELHEMFVKLIKRLDFKPFITEYKGKTVFRMAYNPHIGGDYRGKEENPWIFQWHMYAEQLSMYFIAAGKDDIDSLTAKKLYDGFIRNIGRYKEFEYIYSPTNALFVYQYSHAWIDFSHLDDYNGFNWFKNSQIASKANKAYCIDHSNKYPILGENAWGLTACLTPKGYRNQVIEPNDLNPNEEHVFGVLPPSGALGSLPFVGEEAKKVAENLWNNYPESFGKYGFYDGIASINNKIWVSKDYIGINKGISGLMIDNYLNGTIYKLFMSHPYIKTAINKLGFKESYTND
ncbi:MAG: glucoamylase family protein [Candidatus Izemoplasmatales bacterium]